MREYRDYYNSGGGGGGRYQFGSPGGMTKWVKIIMGVTIGIFILEAILYSAYPALFDKFLHLFGLYKPYLLEELYLWQLVTHMFLHDVRGIFHLLFNMLALFFFAPEIERRLKSRMFLFLYFAGGIVAAVIYTIFYAFTTKITLAIGASGAIMCIIMLYACYWPERQVIFLIFPMTMKTMVAILIGIDLYYSVIATGGNVANIAHLGGAAFGFVFYRYESWFKDFLGEDSRSPYSSPSGGGGGGFFSSFASDKEEDERDPKFEERLDKILEKVDKEGLNSLSWSEKRFLKKASKKYRNKKD